MSKTKFTGRRFAGVKPRDVVLAQCRAQSVKVDDFRYRKMGSDWTTLSKGGCTVIWCSFNGRFMGTTPDGIEFSESSTQYEAEPWYQQLLEFFYEGKPA